MTPLGSVHISFPLRPDQGTDSGIDCVKGLATGESDELLGDMDPLEMEIKWLHSPMVKIADAMENKTTVYKVPVYLLMATLLSTQGLWEMVSPFHLAPTKSTYKSGEVQIIPSLPVGTLAVVRVHPLLTSGRSKEEACSQAAFQAQL